MAELVEGNGLIIHFHKNVAGSNPAGCINFNDTLNDITLNDEFLFFLLILLLKG